MAEDEEKQEMKSDNTTLFEKTPIPKAIIAMVIPTLISQIITVIYNMADTFFIGQMNDPNQIAAASLAMPPFIMLTGIANLFGIGGASLVSQCLGMGDRKKAERCAAFSIWSCIAISFIYGVIIYLARPVLFPLLGTDANTYGYCADYFFWTIAVGSIPTALNACLSHLVRAEGYSKEASIGVALGGVMNIVLDPLLIFALNLEIAGAAMATMISNVIATAYFVVLLYRNKERTVIKFAPKSFTLREGIPKRILLVGLPSFILILLGTFSNIVQNSLAASYSNQIVAGMGIAKKIDMLVFAFANGMTQGVLPLIGYNYASQNHSRMRNAVKTSFVYGISLATFGAILLFTTAAPVVKLFIDDAATVAYGQFFLKVISTTCPVIMVTMMIISVLQATGQSAKPLILSVVRKGSIDVILMFTMNAALQANGLAWATPISDCAAMIVALLVFIPYWKKIKSAV